MSEHGSIPQGPDLALGIEIASIPDGGTLTGQVAGNAVLLVRRGDKVHAVDAHCPHYGAVLESGAVVESSIRCPWHHAAFDLASGASTAPSLKPLGCWSVKIAEGKVFVTDKIAQPKAKKRPLNSKIKQIVIVGAGAAGNAAAETLRQEGYDGSLMVFSEDQTIPYDRPNLSKDYLAGNAPEEWMPLRSTEFYQEANIDMRLNTQIRQLDPSSKTVTTMQGEVISFDKCLLATGASPVKLQVPGSNLPHVFYLRTLHDCKKIVSAISSAKKVAIIGSGFIGLEVASAMRTRGLEVAVVSMEQMPLSRILGEELGKFLLDTHLRNGVKFHLQRGLSRIEPDHILLADGTKVEADLVVVGIGAKPDLELAKGAGLQLDNGRLLVDTHLKTSSEHIYGAGDITRWPDFRSANMIHAEHWVVAGRQGQHAARNMLGHSHPYRTVPFFWTTQFDVTLTYVGCAPTWDRVQLSGSLENRDASVAFISGKQVLAVATLGRDQVSLRVEEAMERNDNASLSKLIA